ncbi:MAG: hypothetical protein EXR51_09985 [Dehalococcoidia bacterium]|nr:hypothetical protein [Dehalococcoidia bacterium]
MTAAKGRSQAASQAHGIPDFASREEMAQWFDTHDMADYWDQLKPTKVRFAKRLSEGLNIRFDPQTLEDLRAEAAEKGVGPTTLVRMWILERLKVRRSKSKGS